MKSAVSFECNSSTADNRIFFYILLGHYMLAFSLVDLFHTHCIIKCLALSGTLTPQRVTNFGLKEAVKIKKNIRRGLYIFFQVTLQASTGL